MQLECQEEPVNLPFTMASSVRMIRGSRYRCHDKPSHSPDEDWLTPRGMLCIITHATTTHTPKLPTTRRVS